MNKVIAHMRILKNGQKILTVPKQKETETWESEDLIELNKMTFNKK